MGKGKKQKGKKVFDFSNQRVAEYTLEGMESEAADLFQAAGRYAIKIRGKIPADNRNNGHLVAPMHIDGIGDICLLMLMHDAGFSANSLDDGAVMEVGVFIMSPMLAKHLGGTGEAAHAIGALMAETEEEYG